MAGTEQKAVLRFWLRYRDDAPSTLAVFRSHWVFLPWLLGFPAIGVVLGWQFERWDVLWFFVGSAVGLLVRDYIAASATSLGWLLTRDHLDWEKVRQSMGAGDDGAPDAG